METFVGDTEESTEDSSGRKKSRLKSLKLRLFRKSKKQGETSRKLSQSASDITTEEALGSNEDLVCSPGAMGSRALSHDSIFLADQALTEAEPTRVLSQENVHINIKALQEKLQQQKFHLGPPSACPPIKRSQDETEEEEEDATPQENLNKALSQLPSNLVLPVPKPLPTKPPKSTSPVEEAPLDFSSPAQHTHSLDTSAARHRLSVKPRNQRASTKKRHSTVETTAPTSEIINSETLKEENEQPDVQDAEDEMLDAKLKEITALSEPMKAETPPKSSNIDSPQKEDISILEKMPIVSTPILRPKSNRPVDVMPRPHSSFIPSETKAKSDSSGSSDIQFLRDTQNKTWAANLKSQIMSPDQPSTSPGTALRPSVEIDRTSAIKRPFPGSGSFHLSASKRKEDEERPRSGSFTGAREHWIKTTDKKLDTSPNISPKVDLKPGAVPLLLGKEETRMIKDSLRKVETVRPIQQKVAGGNSETAKEEEAEEETKTTFGVKLRSTSQSVRLKSTVTEEKQQKQDTSNITDPPPTKNTTAENKQDVATAPSAASPPAPVNTPLPCAEASQVRGAPQAPQGPQAQNTATEVSWMSLAMEKTRSIQSLFTSKFPKDFSGGQTASCSSKTQVQTPNPVQTDTQKLDSKSTDQPLTNVTKTEEHKTTAQTVKPPLPTAQNPSASPFKETQMMKPAAVSQSTEPASVTQGNMWTSQSPLRSVRPVDSTPQSSSAPHSPSQPPLWGTRSLRSTGLTVTQDNTADVKTSGANVEETESPSVWGGSVSKKAAFLEKRAEWTSSPVEVKSETLVSKDTKAESVSQPKGVPERSKEEKWSRKTAESSSAPSPSPLSSTLQSMSDSGELSWIELAKRKSMAWSDKTMD